MPSLYTRAWKTFLNSVVKLLLRLWTFIIYLRSFNSQSTQPSFSTPNPRKDKQPEFEVDLEGGTRSALFHPRSKGLPPNSPSPCLRRPRATTLTAYSPPCAKSTPRRTATSRSSGFSISALESDHETDTRRLSDDSLCSFVTAPSTHSEPVALPNWALAPLHCENHSISQLAESKMLIVPDGRGMSKFIVNHRDSRYVNASRIKGIRLKEQKSLPFKCLSPVKTLSLAPSADFCPGPDKRGSFINASLSLTSLEGVFPKEESRYLEHSCSVDRGLFVMQQFLVVGQSKDEKIRDTTDENVARRPWSIALPIHVDGQLAAEVSFGDPSKSPGYGLGSTSQRRDTRQLLSRWRSGFGLYDVSHVKRTFSVMRSDVEKDEQDVRNMFNRESVWVSRKPLVPSTGGKYRSQLLPANMKLDENVFPHQGKPGRRRASRPPFTVSRRTGNKTLSVARFNQLDSPDKSPMDKRLSISRHRSTTHGLRASPSMQRQLKVERVKRQRKLRQEKMARMKYHSSRQGTQDAYEWFAEDVHIQSDFT